MSRKKEYAMTIYFGRDSDKDLHELLSGKNHNMPKNVLYLKSFEQFYELLSSRKRNLLLYLMNFPKNKKLKFASVEIKMC